MADQPEVHEIDKEMKAKLAMLEFTRAKTEEILYSDEQEDILRQLKAVKAVIDTCEQLRVKKVQELFDKEEAMEKITQYDTYVRKEISKADKDVKAMSEWFDHKKKRKAEQEQQQHVEFEKEMQELKLKNKKQLKEMEVVNVDEEEGPKTKPYSKLRKIEIEKFHGNKMDWPRFWSQFMENIDQKELAATNKLSYLYCYLSPKVKAVINGLPYNEAGYKRAKEIL